jgi:hypothetical protein
MKEISEKMNSFNIFKETGYLDLPEVLKKEIWLLKGSQVLILVNTDEKKNYRDYFSIELKKYRKKATYLYKYIRIKPDETHDLTFTIKKKLIS